MSPDNSIPYATLATVVAQLRREHEDLTVHAVGDIHEELPDYADVPRCELVASVGGIIDVVLDVVASGSAAQLPAVPSVALRRLGQGVQVDSLLRAYRLALTSTQQRFSDIARTRGLPVEDCLTAMYAMWEVGEWFMQQAVREYRAASVGESVRRRVAKAELLRLIAAPQHSGLEIAARARRLGLPDIAYRVALGMAADPDEWVAYVEKWGSTPAAMAVAAEVGDVIAALIPATAQLADAPVLVAAGPSTSLAEAGESWAGARRVLSALPPGRTGWWDAAALSWRLAVPEAPAVTAIVRARYETVFAEASETGAMLLESVWAYMDAGLSFKQAAAGLYVHENTLRHRVAKFEEATGRSLTEPDTRMELLWLRYARELGGGSSGD